MLYHDRHDGSTQVQSPAIGNALRQALSLDAAGSMGMDAGLTVHPVAIVADVRAQLGQNVRTFSGWRLVVGVAAQYGQLGIGLTNAPASNFRYAVPRSVRLWAGAATFVYWRLGLNTPPVTADAVPRALDTSSALSGSLATIGGANAAAPVYATMNGVLHLPANTMVTFQVPEMFIRAPIPFATTAGLNFHADTVNVSFAGEFMWDEYLTS